MLHQERGPTLTPTTPMLLDMIQTILLVARALLDMTPVVEKAQLDMTQAIPMLLGTTQMIPTTHSEKVQTLTPTTPMLQDMILMILMDAKVLLDMTLMLHQEKDQALTPTTPMLLDMIQTILLVARDLLVMTLVIPMLHQGKVPIS